jgi:Uma2 family endonuclease
MTTTLIKPPGNLAEMLHCLGDVDPERILWSPRPGTATEADLLACPRRFVELVDGVLVKKAMGMRESLWAIRFSKLLAEFIDLLNLGILSGPDGHHRLSEELIRLPDLGFTAWANLPTPDAHMESVGDFSPDLAIEILSKSNRPAETRRRLTDFFSHSTSLVWVVDTRKETITVYSDTDTFHVLGKTDTLDGGEVLPGFSLPLVRLFDDRQLNRRPEVESGS